MNNIEEAASKYANSQGEWHVNFIEALYDAFKAGASHQSTQQPVRKTLDEVKDEVAKEAGYNSWIDFAKWCSLVPTMESYCDRVANLYLASNQDGQRWVDLSDRFHKALTEIEKLCDNRNETHEQIWRIAYEALKPEPPTQTNN